MSILNVAQTLLNLDRIIADPKPAVLILITPHLDVEVHGA